MYDYELFLEDEKRIERNVEDFKKKYNYDPKTKTIEYTKGKRVPFEYDVIDLFSTGPGMVEPHNRSYRKYNTKKAAEDFMKHEKIRKQYNEDYEIKKLSKKDMREIADLEKSRITIPREFFDTSKDNVDYIANHEIGHLVDFTNNRRDSKDHSSLVHKYDSGTDLSKLPKDIRRERLTLKKQERELKNEKNPVKKVIKNDKYVRTRDKTLDKLETHVNGTNDETAKAILQHRKDTRNAKRQAVKNKYVTSVHDSQYQELLADAYSLRNANDKNIKKNAKRLKNSLRDVERIASPYGPSLIPGSYAFRAQNAKKVAKMQESVYNMIIEALQEQIDDGEITLEFAEAVNDLAYEKYMM